MISTAPPRPQLDAAYTGEDVTLDFSDVGYINSSGIALIVALLARARADGVAGRASAGCRSTTARSSRSRGCADFMTIIDDGERAMPDLDVRAVSDEARVIAIVGDLTAASEDELMGAYARADEEGVRTIVLDFTGLGYMNSGGIGLLVTLLVRAQRSDRRVHAFGLSEHYRQIFELTRLDEAIGLHADEAVRARRLSRNEARTPARHCRVHERTRRLGSARRGPRTARAIADPGLREAVAEDLHGAPAGGARRARRCHRHVAGPLRRFLAEGQPLLRSGDGYRARARWRASRWACRAG